LAAAGEAATGAVIERNVARGGRALVGREPGQRLAPRAGERLARPGVLGTTESERHALADEGS
jgi:hypothetical protein